MLSMVSEPPPPPVDHATIVVPEQPVVRPLNKKSQGKIPKKIHKAEREKLKRDQLNELFLELGLALEPARQNNGKASILTDATRLLRDLIVQVESLRKENVALVTESHYVTVEKNEIKDENSALEAEISKLKNVLQERLQSNPTWHNNTDPALPSQPTSITLPVSQPSAPPIYVLPFHQDLQAFQDPERASTSPSKPATTQVRRPHARYPTPSDSWPREILLRHPQSGSNSANSEDEEGSDKA